MNPSNQFKLLKQFINNASREDLLGLLNKFVTFRDSCIGEEAVGCQKIIDLINKKIMEG